MLDHYTAHARHAGTYIKQPDSNQHQTDITTDGLVKPSAHHRLLIGCEVCKKADSANII